MSITYKQEKPNEPVNIRSLYLYKYINGHKIKWRIRVDPEMVIIDEGPDSIHDLNNAVINAGKPLPENVGALVAAAATNNPVNNYKKVLDERGIKYDTNEAGQIIVKEIPTNEKLIMQFFDLSVSAPDYAGVPELREKYKEEIEAAGGTSGCTGCKLNGLQRKYRELLKGKFPENS